MAMTLTQDDIDAIAAAILATPSQPIATDASGRVDLVDAPNATAVAAIQYTLATYGDVASVQSSVHGQTAIFVGMIQAITGARGNVAAVASAVTISSGSEQSGTYASTNALDNALLWQVGGSTSIDFYLTFTVPVGSVMRAIVVRAECDNSQVPAFYVSNNASDWTSLGQQSEAVPDQYEIDTFILTPSNAVTAGEDGLVYVRVYASYYAPLTLDVSYIAVVMEDAAGGGLTAQETADAVYNLAPTGSPATDSAGDLLERILVDTGTTIPGLFAASGATITVISAVAGDTITVRVADTWLFTVPVSPADLSDYETVALVVKRSDGQPDDAALLYLRSDTGLQRIGGASAGSTSNGVLDKTTTTFSVLVKSEETQGLRSGDYRWWLKGFDTDQSPPYGFTLVEGEWKLEKAGLAAVA